MFVYKCLGIMHILYGIFVTFSARIYSKEIDPVEIMIVIARAIYS